MIGKYSDPRKIFGWSVTELAKEKEEIVVLSADSGKSSGFGEFIRKYPERYFECGIMEQGVVGVASGLATIGKIPVFCAIAPFVTVRPYEMLRNDLGYMGQNAKVVGRNCGITYSDLGATHHSLEDFAIMGMIPGMVVLAPQDPGEIIEAVKWMMDYQGPVYMRIGNAEIPWLFEQKPFEIGKGRLIREGWDVTIISTGSATVEVVRAGEILEQQGISAELIGMPAVVPLDEKILLESAGKTGHVVIVEEHYIKGGLGTIVLETLMEHQVGVKTKKIGIPHEYAGNGPYNELICYYGLDARSIATAVKQTLKHV